MRALELPGRVPCPVCDLPLTWVLVALVTGPSGELEAVEVICPHCRVPYLIGVEALARDPARTVTRAMEA